MPQHALTIGRCHCTTGLQRFRVKPTVTIPWDSPWNDPLAFPSPNLHSMNEPADLENPDDDPESQFPHGSGEAETGDPDAHPELPPFEEEVNPEDSDFTDDDADVELEEEDVPKVALYRHNLTTLSQRYNIYAVAYGEVIHIYRVRSCINHVLPTLPNLVLRPPTSIEATMVGGFLDHVHPHQINHLVMGDFGNEEILLLACDDGDVLAYYNAKIETALLYIESGHAPDNYTHVEPFFHQNVGRSAWGLAIHKKSRLIAVGNNNHEVHVFAMALRDPKYTYKETEERSYGRDLFLRIRKDANGSLVDAPTIFLQALALGGDKNDEYLESPFFCRRQDSYHFILETGVRGDNIPNVAFANDSDGDAVDVLAIDIAGKLWVMHIWSLSDIPQLCFEGLHQLYSRSPYARNGRRRIPNQHPRGWGVLVLPESSFLPTNTFQESLGLKPAEATYVNIPDYGYYIGTKNSITYIKDTSTLHPWVREERYNLFGMLPQLYTFDPSPDWYDSRVDRAEGWDATQDEAADKSLEIPLLSPPEKKERNFFRPLIADGSSVIRTYEMDIELMGSNPDSPGIMLTDVIYQKRPRQTTMPGVHFPPERLCNLLHVPELSLVVAGSLCGRVALITLTRPTSSLYSFKRGFRVEAILPKRMDENHHLRPICPLLGVAIAPIPSAGGKAPDDCLLGERRYRIMLHYYDHRILSYDVYRDMKTSEISVI
ncbi:hypothetical protein F4859DRAFT_516864 [Xylaria cf. heliscus]|nr:hypothetical protein F4859DRAFT_516864 [Xylaria cf. heliscus]